jgi:hypothetical protein
MRIPRRNATLREKRAFNRCPVLESEFATHDIRTCEYCKDRKLYMDSRTAADIVAEIMSRESMSKQSATRKTRPAQKKFGFMFK